MGSTFTDSERLYEMINQLTEYDEKNNPLTDMGLDYHFEGLTVDDMLEAQRRAISGNTGGGGGGGTSGSSINTEDESPNTYSEWENIVGEPSGATPVPLSAINGVI